jgi:ABC-type transport system involved in multi-copper enzyme maturation permease subunit
MLPIVQRELQVASRKRDIYNSRLRAGVLAALVFVYQLLWTLGSQSRGKALFNFLTYAAVLLCGLEAIRRTSDAISSERREGTLGLLFLTELRGYDVVFGKLAANSLQSLHALLAVLPVFALVLLLGGVTGGEFWRAGLILLNTLFFALSAGLCASTSARENGMGRTFILLLVVSVLPWGLSFCVDFFGRPELSTMAQCLSPFGALAVNGGNYAAHLGAFWGGALTFHISGWLLLAYASRIVATRWQEKGPVPRPLPELSERFAPSTAHRDAALLDNNPILWLTYNPKQRMLLSVYCLAVTIVILLCSTYLPIAAIGFTVTPLFLVLPLKLLVAAHASRHFSEARRSGAMELLSSTPITAPEIIKGHWLGLVRTFLIPAVIVVSVYSWQMWSAGFNYGFGAIFLLARPVDLVLGLAATCSFGMWMGLSRQGATAALFHTVVWTMLVPGLLFCVPNLLIYPALFFLGGAQLKKCLGRELRRGVNL